MSCPDWNALTAHRGERAGVEPAGWNEALAHLDGGCNLCRRQALAADPTLVFRRLAAVPAVTMTEAEEHSEVEAVRAAVAAMRAASRLESLEAGPRTSALRKRWSAGAVAAVLALAALALPSGYDPSKHVQMALASPERSAPPAAAGPLDEPMPAAQQVDLGDEPVVEGVNLPDARVYHMSGDGLSVVMVFDESLDI